MELEHSFTVPVPPERAWETLMDVERVAPCMPGATVDSVEGEVITGRIKVKVGPVTLTYIGKARFSERDPAARSVTLEASGRETRGAGTATATVRSVLHGEGDQTQVVVRTTLAVTGRPAQLGRGALTEVGGRIIDTFAANLAAQLAEGQPAGQVGGVNAGNGAGLGAAAPGPALATGVGDLRLAGRATASLRAAGLDTVADLAARDDQALLALPGVGPQTVAQIRSKLAELGVTAGGAPARASRGDAAASGLTSDERSEEPSPGEPKGRGGLWGDDRQAAGEERGGKTAPPGAPEASEGQQKAPVPSGQAPPRQLRPPDEEAIDLLNVAGLPILKRILPAAGGVIALLALIFAGWRRYHRKRRG